MPWQEVVTVELRQQFVRDALRRVVPVAELCAAYGNSRKTGYKFLARYDTLGAAGLADQSRRPHRSPAARAATSRSLLSHPGRSSKPDRALRSATSAARWCGSLRWSPSWLG
jgi:hypothetical protein